MRSATTLTSFEIIKKALTSSKHYSFVKKVSSSSKKPIRKKKIARRNRKKKVARQNRKKQVGIPDDNYDPLENVPSARYSTTEISAEMIEKLKYVYVQPKMSNNGIKVAEMTKEKTHSFYLFDVPDEGKDTLTKSIEELGGIVTNELGKATRVLFCSTEKMDSDSFFKFLICALGGRFILHASYISKSYDEKKFLDVNAFCSLEYLVSEFNIDASTLAAIKMSIKYRADYAKKGIPAFFRHNILFAVSETPQHADIKLLLEILGAHVQCYDPDIITNHLFTLCIADKNYKMPYGIKDIIPQTTTKELRKLVWKTFNEFLER